MTATWTPPAVWSVPRTWVGERCYVLCGGSSLREQKPVISKLRGRIIAVKQAARLRPDADVMFVAGEQAWDICKDVFPQFIGTHIVARGKSDPRFPTHTKRIARIADTSRLSRDPQHVCGRDAGTSAINLAALFGATEIVLLGYDMTGGHWDRRHPLPFPPLSHFQKHTEILPSIAADLVHDGVRVVNCSPIAADGVFKRGRIEEWL